MSLTRRTLLRAGAASLLLPLLPSLAPRAAAPAVPRRLVVFVLPNGMPDAVWTPTGTGAGWTTSGVLTALAPVRADTAVISGLASLPGTGEFDHAESLTDLLRASRQGAVSFDQRIAGLHVGQVARRVLQVSGERSTPCTYPCEWRRNASWLTDAEPTPRIVSPRALYQTIAPGSAPTRAVLDVARADLARFAARAGTEDQQRLDRYVQGLVDLERRGALTPPASCVAPDAPDDETGAAYTGDAELRTMLTLVGHALACDVTRVVTFLVGNAGSDRPLGFLGLPYGHHALSHTDDPAAHIALGRWAVDLWAHLVTVLSDLTDVDGQRLLDHTDVLFTSDMGDGTQHRRERLPMLLAGPLAAGRAGQHVVVPDGTPVSNLFTTLLQAHGVDEDAFGDATGALSL